jgi:hypothetical protein
LKIFGGRKMSSMKKTFIGLLAMIVLSAGATLTQAQRQTYRGTARVVRQLIVRIDNETDVFRSSLNAKNQGSIYGTSNGNVVTLAEDLDAAVTQLRENFDQRQSTAADAQEVLNRAALIDQVISGRRIRNAAVTRSWTTLRADLTQLATAYNVSWPTVGQTLPYPDSSDRLTGTYRLDSSKSDNPTQAADRATQNAPYGNRARLRDQLARRLESPDQIAIDLRGRDVTLASCALRRQRTAERFAPGLRLAASNLPLVQRAIATLNSTLPSIRLITAAA